MYKQEGNSDNMIRTLVRHINLLLLNRQATIGEITEGDDIQNPSISSIDVLQQFTIGSLK
jgi:hypothetical protein